MPQAEAVSSVLVVIIIASIAATPTLKTSDKIEKYAEKSINDDS